MMKTYVRPVKFFDDNDATRVAEDEMFSWDDHISDATVNKLTRQVLAIHRVQMNCLLLLSCYSNQQMISQVNQQTPWLRSLT